MPNDAIQPDVSDQQANQQADQQKEEQQKQEQQERSKEEFVSREDMMARLVASRRDARAAEEGLSVDQDDTSATDAAAQAARQQAEETILSDEDLSRMKVRVKVNGVEALVPLDQLRATAQKTEAADRYLEEARTTLAEAKALREAQPAAPAAPAPSDDAQGSEQDVATMFTEALFQGDEEKAKEAFRRAIKPIAPPEVDATQIANQVRRQLALDRALDQFKADYSEIATDTHLATVADKFVFDIVGGRPLSQIPVDQIEGVFKEAGARTRQWIRDKAGVSGNEAAPTAARDERLARKATIDNLPAASARSTSVEPPPRTTSSVIEEMRRARGQA
ncbi:MAG: hypothetical protein MUF54_00100 [Polyangiaceae bacterium]|jgi:hypothetical protein|nr:hypothetical protein [Polyangiaceae bacterium]